MSGALHVMFKVAESNYVVAAADVLHMESFVGATKVPGTQSHVVGVMQIRHRVVPIIDLRTRFGLPEAPVTIDSRVVVVQSAERAVGLLVDSAREVVEIAADAFTPPPDVVTQRAQGFVTSLAQAGAKFVMLIDLRKIIGEEVLHGE
ncbi:MAG TPA: chemotaxis protein CheW [Polyangiales bacterium]|jgi:purine-binding chemotaxis protein CheW|nr:chemotaxis protein CheW [Polyangiales bacterium]